MGNSQPGAVLFVTAAPEQCPGCEYDDLGDITIVVSSAESGARNWKVGGTAKFSTRRCPNCGQAIEVMTHLIPVYTREFECPNCHRASDLQVRIRKLTKGREDFEFEALLECKPCNAKSKFRKAIEKVLSIVSIEVGLGGVKVKGSPKAAAE